MSKATTYISGASASVFAMLTVFTITMDLVFYFVFPLMTIISLLTMLVVNSKHLKLSDSGADHEIKNIYKSTYAHYSILERVMATAIFSITLLSLLGTAISIDILVGKYLISHIFLSIFGIMYAFAPILTMFFNTPTKYAAYIALAVSTFLLTISALPEQSLSIANNTLLDVALTLFLVLTAEYLSKTLVKYKIGIKIP